MSLYNELKPEPAPQKNNQPKPIGQQFFEARKKRGLSVDQLACDADVGPLAVRMWETGPHAIYSLQKLLGTLKMSLTATEDEIILIDKPCSLEVHANHI